ncbi:MerR family transcriptional regulator [Streptomyces zagrosensis]|uniref:DNA-binding transcriptional MerR regulator n=1 Tax=Streptomyces zagrosensis TaxID=1042984 RepID=A0A7W9QAF9_9ACTN|nr:MerR family transcriptional regulator [Streptomyces zagrosensis]MBB5936611.1 DNA-binding transcriptional MerR regulator [Streptomyces zagrosensis]
MRIGELAARTGVTVRALRYYEEQQLLTSVRSSSGQRHYPDIAVARVQLIQQLYAAGLSSKTILELLPCVVTGEVTPALLDRLTTERHRIDQQIGSLVSTRDRLDVIITTSSAAMSRGEHCTAEGAELAAPVAAPVAATAPERVGDGVVTTCAGSGAAAAR